MDSNCVVPMKRIDRALPVNRLYPQHEDRERWRVPVHSGPRAFTHTHMELFGQNGSLFVLGATIDSIILIADRLDASHIMPLSIACIHGWI